MKKLLLILTGLFLIAATPINVNANIDQSSHQSKTVYVCTVTYAKSYHAKKNCRGLGNCKGEIKSVTKEKAEEDGRKPCKICKP